MLNSLFKKQHERNARLPEGELERRRQEAQRVRERDRKQAEYRAYQEDEEEDLKHKFGSQPDCLRNWLSKKTAAVKIAFGFYSCVAPVAIITVFFWEGLSPQAKQRSAPPKKPRACLSQAPTKRGVCASLPAALLPVNATHVATVPSTPAAISAKPPAVARPTGV
jgi:hypothetical protein